MMIHRYWDWHTYPPQMEYVSGRIAADLGELKDWTNHNLPRNIREQVEQHKNPVVRSNYIRLLLLHEFGGIWMDHDVTIWDIPLAKRWIAKHGRTNCPSLMSFPAGDPLLLRTFNELPVSWKLSRFTNADPEWQEIKKIDFSTRWAINYSARCYDGAKQGV